MTQFFARKLNKKGFTLAELLIVIAIIAILVAIALPIYTNSLKRARYAVHQSNGRSLKSMSISALLTSKEFAATKLVDGCGWTVTGTYKFDDDTFAITAITYKASGATSKMSCNTEASSYTEFKDENIATIGGYPTSGTIYYEIEFPASDVDASSITST